MRRHFVFLFLISACCKGCVRPGLRASKSEKKKYVCMYVCMYVYCIHTFVLITYYTVTIEHSTHYVLCIIIINDALYTINRCLTLQDIRFVFYLAFSIW